MLITKATRFRRHCTWWPSKKWNFLNPSFGNSTHCRPCRYRPHTVVWGKAMFSVFLFTGGSSDLGLGRGHSPAPDLGLETLPLDLGLDRGPPPLTDMGLDRWIPPDLGLYRGPSHRTWDWMGLPPTKPGIGQGPPPTGPCDWIGRPPPPHTLAVTAWAVHLCLQTRLRSCSWNFFQVTLVATAVSLRLQPQAPFLVKCIPHLSLVHIPIAAGHILQFAESFATVPGWHVYMLHCTIIEQSSLSMCLNGNGRRLPPY